ncbi:MULTISPECIES: LysR family transcriptional regulator [Methylobacterium]|jgi:DNA-binding transcriptional LysR family regulator|uniref:LysR family transcriptional regulator n=1 Tax=Methylobacterium brachiatum TaxID=269660 RepID=A0ABV1RB33_9HYPH|nr:MULTISPECIES: LysR family transcriptional regulator [Methylobacterium]EIZ86998.1 LysR family transcriptional regulator [Methylobacterium sp. GXF4]MDH2312908.1 LysR family transcriptional regulator [Methylobacterium brachiatum]CAA2158298.1 HTH-type transcriptional regulator DmlR [Methylobacterium brachiatum]
MQDHSDLEIFARVVRAGSLTQAGSELGLSVAVVSKRLKRLEERLAVRLLHRTTRRVAPTDVGQEFFQRIAPIVDAIAEAETLVSQRASRARGTLRVTAPSSFGRLHIVPHLSAFFALHPDLVLNLELSDDFEPIVERGYDLAIRVGTLESSGLTAVRLAPVRRVLCARPGYLDAAGRPAGPDDLRNHVCLATENQNPWRLVGPDGPCTVSAAGPLRTHSNEVVREAVIGGLGIALRSTWDVHAELRSGLLEVVLPAYTAAAQAGIYAVYPSRAFVPAKTRAFIEFLKRSYRSSAAWPEP